MESLKEKVMIVNLTISQWGARKYDKGATKEVEEAHQAKEAGRFNKILLQSDTLVKISQVANKVRTFHYENTLPWGDNGDRILPTEKYFDYISNIGLMKMDFTNLCETFLHEYDDEKFRSMQRLNTLYKESDYPHPDSIRKKFDIMVSFMPIADGNDLRVNMSDQVVNTIKNQITKELEKRVQYASNDMLVRLKEAVKKMAETLKDKDKVFRDSLVGNIEALTEDLPLLNFNNDPHVTEVCEWCKALIVNPEDLRVRRKFRFEIADKAQMIHDNIRLYE